MLSRPAKRKGYEHRLRPRYAPQARRTGPKFVKPAPKPKLTANLLYSRFGQHLSILLHTVALTAFCIVGGCAWDFLLMTGFKRGMLMGVMTYGTFLSVSVALETKVQRQFLNAATKIRARVLGSLRAFQN